MNEPAKRARSTKQPSRSAELIHIATAMRGLGARKVEVHADGGLSVEFGPMPTPVVHIDADENGFLNDRRKLTPEEMERRQLDLDEEAIPGN